MTNILTTKFDFEIENFIAALYFLHRKYKPNLRINLLRLNCKLLLKNIGTYFGRSPKMEVLTRGTGFYCNKRGSHTWLFCQLLWYQMPCWWTLDWQAFERGVENSGAPETYRLHVLAHPIPQASLIYLISLPSSSLYGFFLPWNSRGGLLECIVLQMWERTFVWKRYTPATLTRFMHVFVRLKKFYNATRECLLLNLFSWLSHYANHTEQQCFFIFCIQLIDKLLREFAWWKILVIKKEAISLLSMAEPKI